jgi:hypothetical protein
MPNHMHDDHQLAAALHAIDRDAQRAGDYYDGLERLPQDVNIFISEQGVAVPVGSKTIRTADMAAARSFR